MRLRRTTVATVLAALAAAGLTIGAAPASAEGGTVLYVNNLVTCSDTTTNSANLPYCTIQAAADVAQPGQTVSVEPNQHDGTPYPQATLTHSGTPGNPITIESDPRIAGAGATVGSGANDGFVVNGAHDIVLEHFTIPGTGVGVSINNSSDITLDGSTIYGGRPDADGIDVTGTTSNVTISRDNVGTNIANGTANLIWIGPRVSHTTVTTNAITVSLGQGAISATDAPDTIVTSNTITFNCASGIDLAGSSPDSVIENNVMQSDDMGAAPECDPTVGNIEVSAGSVAGTVSDYNVISPSSTTDPLYNWNGTAYGSLSGFTAATGQGAHDLNPGTIYWTQPVPEAIDSADANAPGELSTDINGNNRADDPTVPNTGTGPGYYDRGAAEVPDPLRATSVSASPSQGVGPLTVAASGQINNPWGDAVTYTFDFGDGSSPVVTSTPTATHTYRASATEVWYYVAFTVTASNGTTQTVDTTVTILPASQRPLPRSVVGRNPVSVHSGSTLY